MPKPITPPQAGSSIRKYVGKVQLWRDIAASQKALCQLLDNQSKTSSDYRRRKHPSSVQPLGVNKSGVLLPENGFCSSIVGYSRPAFNTGTAAFCAYNTFEYTDPKEDNICCFGVLNCPVGPDGVSEVTMSGLATVRIDVANANHTRVQAMVDNTTALKTVNDCYPSGGKIVWKERDTETGEMWAVIMLTPCQEGKTFIGVTPATIAATPVGEEPVTTDVDFGQGPVKVCTGSKSITSGSTVMVIPVDVDKCRAVKLC